MAHYTDMEIPEDYREAFEADWNVEIELLQAFVSEVVGCESPQDTGYSPDELTNLLGESLVGFSYDRAKFIENWYVDNGLVSRRDIPPVIWDNIDWDEVADDLSYDFTYVTYGKYDNSEYVFYSNF